MSISNDESAISDTTGAHEPRRIVVIGAGPAGLTAAYEFMKLGAAADVTILESDTVVGGISQTVQRDGWRFDIGGHRFFTKVKVVDELWDEILAPETMLDRPRQSRILYRGKLYDYPLVPMNALRNLGPVEAVQCVAVVRVGAGAPAEEPGQPRRLLHRTLRAPALRALLQGVHARRCGAYRRRSSPPTGARSG